MDEIVTGEQAQVYDQANSEANSTLNSEEEVMGDEASNKGDVVNEKDFNIDNIVITEVEVPTCLL